MTKIYCDIAEKREIKKFVKSTLVSGFTTNPTLMRQAGAKNYEVDINFQKRFIEKKIKYSKFFRYKNKNKSYFNLRALINYQLSELGLEKIYNINRDTYSNENLFFSHRRAVHKGQKATGRLINLISLS